MRLKTSSSSIKYKTTTGTRLNDLWESLVEVEEKRKNKQKFRKSSQIDENLKEQMIAMIVKTTDEKTETCVAVFVSYVGRRASHDKDD